MIGFYANAGLTHHHAASCVTPLCTAERGVMRSMAG